MCAHEDERAGALFLWMLRKEKSNEVSDGEEDDIGSSGRVLQPPHLAVVVCLFSEGVWEVIRIVLTLPTFLFYH